MFTVTKIADSVNHANTKEFIADVASDVDNLPHIETDGSQSGANENNDKVAAGSSCFVITPPSLYILGNDDIWHLVS